MKNSQRITILALGMLSLCYAVKLLQDSLNVTNALVTALSKRVDIATPVTMPIRLVSNGESRRA